ncbi:hypothetical protein B5G52_02055 [Pseudoalteromonas sp. A601]|uniref:START domain-containing protein n=1 Tax=Pseudoalteromonas sp. A601 TaxID=1967839 RepID=UPI000B3C7D3E|nr:START domain-containing protein [Pseudoalteromonas sp. A601]OUS74153.1 hypothetical protein B5G52_02055 [Pseudoalteromonas sp. A601]
MLTKLLLFITAFYCLTAPAQEKQWQLWKQQDGASISYKKHENGILEVRGSITVHGSSADDFMALLSDTQQAPLWIENVTFVEVLSRLSSSETIVYTQLDSPWPVTDRDMVSYSCYRRLSPSQTELIIKAYPDYKAELDSVIRIKDLQARWLLNEENTEQGRSLTLTHDVYADPGGAIPHWISNKVGLKSALKTLLELRRQLNMKAYTPALQISQAGDCA